MNAETSESDDDRPAPALLCAGCDHDLRTIAANGVCPECGLAVEESIRVIGDWTRRRLRMVRAAIWAFLIGAVTWCGFALAVSTVPTPATRVFAAIALAIHAASICVAGICGTVASSRQPQPVRTAIVWVLTSVLAASGVFVLLAALRFVQLANNDVKTFFAIAAATRISVASLAAWWLIHARRSFEGRWSRLAIASAVALGLMITMWLALGAALLIGTIWQVWSSLQVDLLGEVSLACDAIASLVIAGVALPMLGTTTRRMRATRP